MRHEDEGRQAVPGVRDTGEGGGRQHSPHPHAPPAPPGCKVRRQAPASVARQESVSGWCDRLLYMLKLYVMSEQSIESFF